jgi:tyrosyl-tRNA synthetase
MGGTDQRFNLLMGRELQKDEGQRPQTVMMVPLLEGLDGVQKMSKSLGNYVGITDAPNDMFGKIMSISDELMWRYYDLLSFRPLEDVATLKQQVAGGANPRDIKILLAKEIISRFHDDAAAEAAHHDFTQRFSKNALPDDVAQISIPCNGAMLPIANVLKEAGLVDSTSEAIRMIKQGAVKLNGDTKIDDTRLEVVKGSSGIYQVGKRKFAKITLV